MNKAPEKIVHNGYVIHAHGYGPQGGYMATAIKADWPPGRTMPGGPPEKYRSDTCTGPGAKRAAIEAVKRKIDAGPPDVKVWTIIDGLTGAVIGRVRAGHPGAAASLARHAWRDRRVRVQVDQEFEWHPWTWNDRKPVQRLDLADVS